MSPPDERRQGTLEIVLAIVFLLPIAYVLSVGPVVKVAQLLEADRFADSLKTFYAPLVYLHDRTPLRQPLEWYVGAWGVR